MVQSWTWQTLGASVSLTFRCDPQCVTVQGVYLSYSAPYCWRSSHLRRPRAPALPWVLGWNSCLPELADKDRKGCWPHLYSILLPTDPELCP